MEYISPDNPRRSVLWQHTNWSPNDKDRARSSPLAFIIHRIPVDTFPLSLQSFTYYQLPPSPFRFAPIQATLPSEELDYQSFLSGTSHNIFARTAFTSCDKYHCLSRFHSTTRQSSKSNFASKLVTLIPHSRTLPPLEMAVGYGCHFFM